jgi:hypothetical protein
MQLNPDNRALIRQLFGWWELDQITPEAIVQIAASMDVRLDATQLRLKSPWKSFKIVEIFRKDGTPLFYLKELWEMNYVREILAMEIAQILDPELSMPQYAFGTFKTGLFKQIKAFLLTSWIAGKPITKNDALTYAYALGRQYEFGRWLCLYDCHPRHYFLQSDGSLRRIDYGLAFSKFQKKYEGYADIWPKELFTHTDFLAGIKYEYSKIHARFEVGQDRIFDICRQFSQLQRDDLIDFDTTRFFEQLVAYWQREAIINENGCLISPYSFLHSPIDTAQPDACPWEPANFEKKPKKL